MPELHTIEIESGFWLTPTASDGIMSKKKTDNLYVTESGTVRLRNKSGTSSNAGLANQVMYRTPTVGMVNQARAKSRDYLDKLKAKGQTITLAAEVLKMDGGTLNPKWVEWLMGWPLEWTNLDASETDKYRQWLCLHGIYSTNE
jgi:hypothetical protein